VSQAFTILAFYKFVPLSDFRELKGPLLEFLNAQEIRGTILLAPEGINGTVSGSDASIKTLIARFKEDERFADLEYKFGEHCEQPFKKTKVKLKKEIISFGRALEPTQPVGTYVDHEQWNALLNDENVIVIDTRNNYEVELGKFPGAINPDTESFRELVKFADGQLAEHRDAKIAMYCTGGIRCEKFSSYLIDKGFKSVFHLKGGILKYLADVPQSENRWEGTCYVFDDRRFLK
jgi:UPF0176 protein